MKPIGLLMWEHRLIERMVAIFNLELDTIQKTSIINPDQILIEIDFFKTYADRTHHGKEEDILFKTLTTKNLTPDHTDIIHHLIEDHTTSRKTITALRTAVLQYTTGDPKTLDVITSCLRTLTTLYPPHITLEDKHFFYPAMNYLTADEQNTMLHAFWDFDQHMIHEKYIDITCSLENSLHLAHSRLCLPNKRPKTITQKPPQPSPRP